MTANLGPMPDAGSTAERYDRLKKGRDLVRRTALLLSADLPLHDLLGQLTTLLSAFVDASSILVAIGNESNARFEYIFEDGMAGRPDDSTVYAGSATAEVLRTGEPILRRKIKDWPTVIRVKLGGRETAAPVSAIFMPIPFGGRTVGVLSVQSRRTDAYDDDDVAMLETCAIYLGARVHDEDRRVQTESLKRAAATDALTGLANRRAFDESLAREWQRCARSGRSLALAMMDVDYFKKFNDAYGHVAGDACLRQVAQAIANCVKRPGDLAARYGGEEFALILPESDTAGAVQLGESICDAVRGIAIPHQGSSLGYTTLSIGVAALVPDAEADPQNLVTAADAKLYEAKQEGRNRVAANGHLTDAPSVEARVSLQHNLPSYLTAIVGQERDVSEIMSMLETSRLVSVLGPGGIGKTRLAVQVAERLLETYPDGVRFVDLSSLDDPMLVLSAIADAFRLVDEGGVRPLIERVCGALKAKKSLIVLDNCEHVLSAAADAANQVLCACPDVRILATGREPLGVAGEYAYRMAALPVPPIGEIMTVERVMQYGAAALFVARAHTAQRSFLITDETAGIVADIVRRLDGIALAIELAASRIKVLSLSQLDQRLDERFKLLSGGSRTVHPRQKTLHALIAWSYDLLSEAERSMLRKLAIFRGGFTLDAVESVCIDEGARWEALDLISSLVDKSLVVPDDAEGELRYRFLESTREFVQQRLVDSEEREGVAARHCRYFAQMALRAHDSYWHTQVERWLTKTRADLENYRAAIGWGISDGNDTEAAAVIVASLRWMWRNTSRREGRLLLERAEAVLGESVERRVRGLLALARARLGWPTVAHVKSAAASAARLLSGGADEMGHAEALALAALAIGTSGQIHDSAQRFEEAISAARATGVPRLKGYVLATAAYWFCAAGDRERSRALFDEAAALLRECDDQREMATLQANRADFLFWEGDIAGALASVAEAEAHHRRLGEEIPLLIALHNRAAYQLESKALHEASAAAREGLQLAVRAQVAFGIANGTQHLARIATHAGDFARASRMLGYADEVYRRLGNAREPTEQLGFDRTLELIRAALPEDRIAALMAEGAALDQDAAVAEAMAISQPSA